MTPVFTAIGFAITIALLFSLSRRLLGVPVGWVRTLVVAVVVTGAMSGFLEMTTERLGLDDAALRPEQTSEVAVVALVLLLLVAWGVALGVGGLVLLEALAPTGSLPSPVAVLRDLPARRRRSRRYGQIVRVAVKHGLGGFLRAGSRLPDGFGSGSERNLSVAYRCLAFSKKFLLPRFSDSQNHPRPRRGPGAMPLVVLRGIQESRGSKGGNRNPP